MVRKIKLDIPWAWQQVSLGEMANSTVYMYVPFFEVPLGWQFAMLNGRPNYWWVTENQVMEDADGF